jgi:2,3-diketo-5-methylthio-1-phosphopentane phosphatase
VQAPLYDDVLPALETLTNMGVAIYIYSSGSIEAQKLLFAHTNHGDIRQYIKDCMFLRESDVDFDPTALEVGNKFDVVGYQRIMEQTGVTQWTFFSDVLLEIESSKKAEMKGYVVVREGNRPLTDAEHSEFEILTDGLSQIADLAKQSS